MLELSTHNLGSITEPEVYGLALGIPTLVASIVWWRLRRPERTPTWQTIAPVFVLAVAPSTAALLDETTDRWFLGEDASAGYQVRMVALLAIGVGAGIVGAGNDGPGLFFPGIRTHAHRGRDRAHRPRSVPPAVALLRDRRSGLLIAAGAGWEWVRQRGRAGATWVRSMT